MTHTTERDRKVEKKTRLSKAKIVLRASSRIEQQNSYKAAEHMRGDLYVYRVH